MVLGKFMKLGGSVSAPPSFVFTGSGNVVFASGSRTPVYPQWWGAVGDASTASGPAFISAVAAAGTNGIIEVPPGTYNVTFAGQTGDALSLRQGQTLRGHGAIFSNQAARSAAGFLRIVDVTDVRVEGIEYDGNISVVTPDLNNGISAIISNRADRLSIKNVYIHDSGLDSLYIEDSQDVVISDSRIDHSPRFGLTFGSTLENSDNLQLSNVTFTNDGYGDSGSGGCIDLESTGFLVRYAQIVNMTCKPHANVFSAGIVLHDVGHNLANITCIMPTNIAKPCVNTQPDASSIRISNSYFSSSSDAIANLELEGDDIQISNSTIINTGDGTPANTYAIRGIAGTGATDVTISNSKIVGYQGAVIQNLNTSAIWQLNNVTVAAGASTVVTIQLNGPLNSVTGGYFERAQINVNGKGHRITGATFDGIGFNGDGINVSASSAAYVITNNILSRYTYAIEIESGALNGYI